MKKLLSLILAAVAAAALFSFAGCGEDSQGELPAASSGNVTVCVSFTAKKEVAALSDETSVKDYMDALKARGELVFGGEYGDYGFFISSVYGKTAGENEFWAVYTDLVKLDDVIYSNAEYGTYNCDGKTLNSASYGVSSLPCVEGYTYALVLTSF